MLKLEQLGCSNHHCCWVPHWNLFQVAENDLVKFCFLVWRHKQGRPGND